MKRSIHIFVISLILVSAQVFSQQQGLQSNFMLHQYVFNTAYIGSVPGNAFNAGYRNQWSGFEGAPRTLVLSGYGSFKKKPMTAGALLVSDRIGLMDRTSFYGLYSYTLKLNKKSKLNLGLGAGGIQYSVRAFEARLYDKDDALISSEFVNGYAFDANAGFYFYTRDFFLGGSNQHMASSRIRWNSSLGKLTSHYYFYTGYNFRLGKKKEWVIQPSVLARLNAPVPAQFEGMLKIMYKEIVWLGGNYRHNNSSSFMAGGLINKQFSISYAYDLSMNALSYYNTGSHEIFISYLMPLKKRRSKSEQIQDADEQELNTIDNTIKTTIKAKKSEEEKAGEENKSKPEGSDTKPEKKREPKQNRKKAKDKISEKTN